MGTLQIKKNIKGYAPTNIEMKNAIAFWLYVLCGMIFLMVIVGGLTRLTHSGLSMVNWRPVTGWLPPISIDDWENAFGLYKNTPEYNQKNYGMSLEDFKSIFWLEFIHRLWGRIIGIAFAIPFIYFLIKGWIGRKLIYKLIAIFLMGAFQ